MKEIWKDIEGYEGLYQISNFGNVKSLFKKMIFKRKGRNKWGYKIVKLSKERKQKNFSVHRLVAKAFIENPENKTQVNHIDGDKGNNSVDNLEWVTPSENQKHAYSMGLARRCGENNSLSKLTEKDVRKIKQMLKDEMRVCEIYKMLSSRIKIETIRTIKGNRSWKNVKI